MTQEKFLRRYEVAIFAALAITVVMTIGALLNAAFNASFAV